MPKIDFECPPNSEKRGDTCWVRITDQVKIKYECPLGSEQPNSNTCVYKIPPHHYEFYCPSGFEKRGNKCIKTITDHNCHDTHVSTGGDCEAEKASEPVIYNNNTVHAPTNITSTNIHNINITSNDCGNGAKERVIVTNGKTERVPCPVRVPVPVPRPYPVPVPQPYPVHVPQPQSNCCMVQTQQCSAPNMCEYVPQQRCGSHCNSF